MVRIFAVILSLCCCWTNTYAQNVEQQLIPLEQAIVQLSQLTTQTINYNPDLLQDYRVAPPLQGDLLNQLEKLLADTPLAYRQVGTVILIYLPEKTNFQLCGYVLDERGNPLPYVNVFLRDAKVGTVTDAEGFFELDGQTYKNDQLQLSYLGYQTQKITVQTLTSDNCPSFLLDANAAFGLSEVVITDYQHWWVNEQNDFNAVKINYEIVAKQLPPLEQDVLRNIQLLPGITSATEGVSSLQIRGSNIDQNLILWEGVPLYSPGHFFDMISTINPFIIQQVAVHKGISSPDYEDRIGGIVDITGPQQAARTWKAGVGSTLSETHAYLNAPIIKDRLSVLLAGRQSLGNRLQTPTLQNYTTKIFQSSRITAQNDTVKAGIATKAQENHFYDWNIKMIAQPLDQLQMSFNYLSNQNDFSYQLYRPKAALTLTDYIEYRGSALRADVRWSFTERWSTSLAFQEARYRYVYTLNQQYNEDNLYQLDQRNTVSDQTFKWTSSFQPDTSVQVQLGTEFSLKQVGLYFDEKEANNGGIQFEDTPIGGFTNLYGIVHIKQPRYLVNLGLRSTYYHELSDWNFSPRVTLRLPLADKWNLEAGTGTFFQYINQHQNLQFNELGLNTPIWLLSEPLTEKIQKAQKYLLGIDFNDASWTVELDAYYTKTSGLHTLTPLLNPTVQQNLNDFFSGSGRTYGLDAFVQYRQRNYHSWISYSNSNVLYLFPDIQPDFFRAPDHHQHNLSFLQQVQWKNWRFFLNYQWKSGLYYSAPARLNQFYEDDGSFYYLYEYDKLNQKQLPYYSRLDLGVRYLPQISTHSRCEIACTLLNLLDRSSPYTRNYFLENTSQRNLAEVEQYYLEKSSLGFTPTLLLRFYWE